MSTTKKDHLLMEIRAGAGGEEAALFAHDLFNMYSKYALSRGWGLKVLDSNQTGLQGFKQIVFQIKGEKALEELRFEGGVHRIQRIPKTEKGNRVHTSTASVAVLPMPSETEIDLKKNDIKMEFFKSSGPGGQYVNKRQTAVRITHIPTGMVVSSQESRNLESNKEHALEILKAKLFEMQRQRLEKQITDTRKSQIGKAERAEKIRTYNFPQDRITDHRIKKSWHKIDKIMSGDLGQVIKRLQQTLS